jgi:hypothetical protein
MWWQIYSELICGLQKGFRRHIRIGYSASKIYSQRDHLRNFGRGTGRSKASNAKSPYCQYALKQALTLHGIEHFTAHGSPTTYSPLGVDLVHMRCAKRTQGISQPINRCAKPAPVIPSSVTETFKNAHAQQPWR